MTGHQSRAEQGIFLTFEGIDGSGKSTQARLVASHLREQGFSVVETFEPGDSPIGATLRHVLLHSEAMDARTEALLYAADRAEHVARVVRPALAKGAVVISDRYIDSSIAYQGAGRVLHSKEIAALSRWATHGLQPARTYLFDVDIDLARRRRTGDDDRLEGEAAAFHERVRRGFLDIAAAEPLRVQVIDASQSLAQVTERVMSDVDAYIASRESA